MRELRNAVRSLRRSPGFATAAVLVLAVGVGGATALFAVVHAVLLRPLPFPEAERLVRVWETQPELGAWRLATSAPTFEDWRERAGDVLPMAAFMASQRTLLTGGVAERVAAQAVTAGYFEVLAVAPRAGRTFQAGEEVPGAHRVAVLSHGFWQRALGGDPAALDRPLVLDGVAVTVVGIMPPGFEGVWEGVRPELWTPLPLAAFAESRGQTYLQVVGRLAPGVSLTQASAELEAAATEVSARHPEASAGRGVAAAGLRDHLVGAARPTLRLFAACAALLLAVVAVDLAGLLLARSVDRERDVAVRLALGAPPGRLARAWVLECQLLGLAGGLAGLALAAAAVPLLLAVAPANLPGLAGVRLEPAALAFALAAALAVPLGVGLATAAAISGRSAEAALREGGRTIGGRARGRARTGLVVAQVALSLVLLVAAGLLARSLFALGEVDLGFAPRGLLVASLDLDPEQYGEPGAKAAFYDELRESLEALPGVEAAGAVTALPMRSIGIRFEAPYHRAEDPEPRRADARSADFHSATVGYLETLGAVVARGRLFTEQDRDGAPLVLVVNEALAAAVWPGEEAVGKRLRLYWSDWQVYEVVGVVRDFRSRGPALAPRPELFVAHAQIPYGPMNVVVRFTGDPAIAASAVRERIRELDPREPAFALAAMEDLLAEAIARERFAAALLAAFALAASGLAASGLYASISYSVARRRRELALRLALGASPAGLRSSVLRGGMVLATLGAALGLLPAVLLGRLLASLLHEVSPVDPGVFAGALAALAATALAATWLPARRATRVDPGSLVRGE